MHELAVAGHRGLHDQPLLGDLELIQRRARGRQRAVAAGPDARPVGQAGHLDAGVLGQVGDRAAVADVDVTRRGMPVTTLSMIGAANSPPCWSPSRRASSTNSASHCSLSTVDADLQVVPVPVQVVADQLRRPAEPRPVLAGVMAGLGVEVAGELHQLGADPLDGLVRVIRPGQQRLGLVDVAGRHHRPDPRDQVLAAAPERGEPGGVVHPGGVERDLVLRHAEFVGEQLGGVLHAVAQPDHADAAQVGGPDVGRHRVGVVEQQRVRADSSMVCGHHPQRLDRAQAAEDAARAQRVADDLVDPVLARDQQVMGVGLDPADLEHGQHEVGAAQRGRAGRPGSPPWPPARRSR